MFEVVGMIGSLDPRVWSLISGFVSRSIDRLVDESVPGMFVVVGMMGSLFTRLESLIRGFVFENSALRSTGAGALSMFEVVGMIGILSRVFKSLGLES